MDSFAGTMSSILLCVNGLKAPPLTFSVSITHGFKMYPVAPLNSNLAWFSCRGRSVCVCVCVCVCMCVCVCVCVFECR